MILSVVIVNYNVKFFLEQCLSSLKKAIDGSDLLRNQAEVLIVDNASGDGSLDFLIPLYPSYTFIQNVENSGFAKANNQALPLCSGELVLFLNPDTILAEDSLDICVGLFRSSPHTGACGVHMVDGAGLFLKESKRGFPSPAASFFKLSGLTHLFPHSRFFSSYYMGHLHERSSHIVDILSGAFMMVRKSILDKIGGFDEQFFMYAEDIDLSYRITLSGYQNYYLSETSIIHFKGESTRKDARYINMFYDAMELFRKKHFESGSSTFQAYILRKGIRFRQSLAGMFLSRPLSKTTAQPVVFVRGPKDSKAKWKSKLAEKGIEVTENEKNAQEVLFCENRLQTWKEIIAQISIHPVQHLYKFHGSGTHAAVGSASSRHPGNVYEF